MIKNKKTQMSIIESLFMIMLFVSFTTYYSYSPNDVMPESDYSVSISSAVDMIYSSDEFREKIFSENLTDNGVSDFKWQELNQTISKMFYNYEFKISDDNITKTIFSCKTGMYNKLFSEKIMFYNKNYSSSGFKIIRLGVCY